MSKHLWLMQGLPGSGKSSRARIIARECLAVILSTDDYHHDLPNPHLYDFKRDRVAEFHKANQERCEYFMRKGVDVIIDNTNLTNRAIGPYVRLAIGYGYNISIQRCEGNFGSVHGVPEEIIEKMRAQMEVLDQNIAFYADPI